MSEERVTIRQLARLSGVSIGTVSRALNGYADVNPETRERIMRLARELDYTPAAAARSLKTQRSHVIGVFLETGEGHPDLQHPFFHEVLVGLKNSIGAGGYDLLLFASEHPGNGYGSHTYLKRCRHHDVEGAVLMGTDPEDPEVRRLVRSELPTVGVDVELEGPATTFVISRQHRRRSQSRALPAQPGAPPHRHDHRPARDHARAPTACAATARRCRRPGSPTATSTSRTETSTWRAAAARWPTCSHSTNRPQRSSPRRT